MLIVGLGCCFTLEGEFLKSEGGFLKFERLSPESGSYLVVLQWCVFTKVVCECAYPAGFVILNFS